MWWPARTAGSNELPFPSAASPAAFSVEIRAIVAGRSRVVAGDVSSDGASGGSAATRLRSLFASRAWPVLVIFGESIFFIGRSFILETAPENCAGKSLNRDVFPVSLCLIKPIILHKSPGNYSQFAAFCKLDGSGDKLILLAN